MGNQATWRCHLMGVVPLGLFSSSVFFDVNSLASGDGHGAMIAFWLIAIGVTIGLTAAPFAVADWRRIPQGAFAKDLGLWHCVVNLLMLALFCGSLLLRVAVPAQPPLMAVLLSFIGVPMAMVTGWLAGEFSDRMMALRSVIQDWRG